jgi:hypothetical protein
LARAVAGIFGNSRGLVFQPWRNKNPHTHTLSFSLSLSHAGLRHESSANLLRPQAPPQSLRCQIPLNSSTLPPPPLGFPPPLRRTIQKPRPSRIVGFVAPTACRRGAAVAVDGCEPRGQSAGLANSSVSFVWLLRKCFIFREIVVSFGMNEMTNYCKTISLALVL